MLTFNHFNFNVLDMPGPTGSSFSRTRRGPPSLWS